ncbi:unnamed protein product [Cylicocyclus nassatus]|uniref:Sulfotransferase n=1 Tax=Cylicocyclus nassatus TaxID=53992 RepID=A0AA36GPV2_CYLNA|nr:unnamed protein product [Cylicocyclus nassatus]
MLPLRRREMLLILLSLFMFYSLLSEICTRNSRDSEDVSYAQKLCLGKTPSACIPPLQTFPAAYKTANPYHLLACTIQKNFSTMLTAIICYLYNETAFIENGRIISQELYFERFCKDSNEYWSLSAISQKLDTDLRIWTKLAVIRDPFERFVSGFADKCLKRREWEGFPLRCGGCTTNLTCFMEKLYYKMMQWRPDSDKRDFDANHFFPQSWRCEFNSHLSDYHILQYNTFNPSKLVRNLLAILKEQNVSDFSIDYIERSVFYARTNHSTMGTVEQEETRRSILSNSYLLDLLIKMFYYDFVLFGFPFPVANQVSNYV